MSKSAIYIVNNTAQDVVDGGTISLGTVIRRYGCNLGMSGNALQTNGTGYYEVRANVTAEPDAIGEVTATLYKDGVAIPGAKASGSVSTADNPVTLPIDCLVRETCCDSTSNITLVLSGGSATVTNVATVGEKL